MTMGSDAFAPHVKCSRDGVAPAVSDMQLAEMVKVAAAGLVKVFRREAGG
jgi:hypothetical protein